MLDEQPPARTADTHSFTAHWAAKPQHVVTARHQLTQWLHDIALNSDRAYDIVLAVTEAVTNAMEHGSRFDPTQPVSLNANLHGESLTVMVTDRGRWIEPSHQLLTPTQLRGRGLHLIHELADHVDITPSPHGTHITMRFDAAEQIPRPLTGLRRGD